MTRRSRLNSLRQPALKHASANRKPVERAAALDKSAATVKLPTSLQLLDTVAGNA